MCDRTSMVPDNANDLQPMRAQSKSPSMSAEHYELDREGFFDCMVKKWKNTQQLVTGLKNKYEGKDIFQTQLEKALTQFRKYMPVEINFLQNQSTKLTFKAAVKCS